MIKYYGYLRTAKPCPFCGNERIAVGFTDLVDDEGQLFYLACITCEAKTKAMFEKWQDVIEYGVPSARTRSNLLDLWNNRAGVDEDGLQRNDPGDERDDPAGDVAQ